MQLESNSQQLKEMITARNIYKNYGKVPVLKGIDIDIVEGEVTSIVGASGAGKSTLLHIIGTLDDPDKGEVIMAGENVHQLNNRALSKFRNENIGFVFQFHHLLPEFNAVENVSIPGFIAKKRKKEVEDRAKELLTLLGLSHRLDHKPNQLSGGEQQRVAVARALINSPKVVLADEPSGNLDSKNALELHNLFFQLRDDLNQTFIIATHNEQLSQMSDKLFRIKDGMISQEK